MIRNDPESVTNLAQPGPSTANWNRDHPERDPRTPAWKSRAFILAP